MGASRSRDVSAATPRGRRASRAQATSGRAPRLPPRWAPVRVGVRAQARLGVGEWGGLPPGELGSPGACEREVSQGPVNTRPMAQGPCAGARRGGVRVRQALGARVASRRTQPGSYLNSCDDLQGLHRHTCAAAQTCSLAKEVIHIHDQIHSVNASL